MKKLLALWLFSFSAFAGPAVYGDSVSVGVGATSGNGYVPLLQTALGVTLTNYAVSGAMAADQAVVAKSGVGDKFVINIGTNDSHRYGTDTTKREYFKQSLRALIALSAMPARINGRAGALSGTWSDDAYSVNVGTWSMTANDTATFTVSGTAVYVGMKYYAGAYGAADILVDGVVKASITTPNPGFTTGNNSYPYDQDGTLRFGGLSPGSHTVQIKIKAGSGSPAVVYLQWVAGSDQLAKPSVYVSKIHRWNATGYASVPNSDANIADYNAMIAAIVAEFQADGLNVTLVDPALDPSTDLSSDGIHPNNAGHLKIKNAFYAAMSGPPPPPPPPPTYVPANIVVDTMGNFFGIKVDGTGMKQLTQ